MQDLTDFEKGWIIGILEGEGSFIKRKDREKSVVISVEMTDKDVVERLRIVTNMGTIISRPSRKENWKPSYVWNVRKNADVDNLLRFCLPRMGIRRRDKITSLIEARNPNKAKTKEGALLHQ